MPSWMRSSSVSSEPWYFLAIETTSRRFALIMRSLAARSPRSMRLARSISSCGVSSRWRPISLRKSWSVSVVAAASACVVDGGGLGLAPAVVAQVDAALLELLVEGAELGLLELERLGQLVDLAEVDAARLLAAVEQGRDRSTGGVADRTHTGRVPHRKPGRSNVEARRAGARSRDTGAGFVRSPVTGSLLLSDHGVRRRPEENHYVLRTVKRSDEPGQPGALPPPHRDGAGFLEQCAGPPDRAAASNRSARRLKLDGSGYPTP